jgi:hypothetical protein
MDDKTTQRLSAVLDQSRSYLGKLFGTTSFANNANAFARIIEPTTLSAVRYNLRLYRQLTGHPISGSELPLKYAFGLATPVDGSIKERFIAECRKQAEGKPHDKNVITQYYLPFVPSDREMQELTSDLATLLGREAFKDKGYQFAFHLACLTADWDFALIFIEAGSVSQIVKATE